MADGAGVDEFDENDMMALRQKTGEV